jgi:hypothetical protein
LTNVVTTWFPIPEAPPVTIITLSSKPNQLSDIFSSFLNASGSVYTHIIGEKPLSFNAFIFKAKERK